MPTLRTRRTSRGPISKKKVPSKATSRKKIKAGRVSKVAVKKSAKKSPAKARTKRPLATAVRIVKTKKSSPLPLERHPENPILSPLAEHAWEAHQTFNAGAVQEGNKVHLVYRSIGRDGLSRFGYAASETGLDIDERSEEPIFSPVLDPKNTTPVLGWYASGGSWGGAEDPRLTSVGDRIYMLYTGFDHGGFPRVALTSIHKDDFLDQRWDWKRSQFISPPGEVHKNWTIFPEKINGKYAILHSLSPEIKIEYLDDLDFEDGAFVDSKYAPKRTKGAWEETVRGAGPPPIKTKEGWLVLYHGTTKDCGYKMGAMLLDLKQPTKIIARADEPILEPSAWYEREGWKGNIVYSCGAAVIGGSLLVYYGGADSVLCVAKTNLQDFLDDLVGRKKPKLPATKQK